MIRSVREFFEREALSMQQGGPEYVYSKEWLGIYWPADEYVFIKLTSEDKLAGVLRGSRPAAARHDRSSRGRCSKAR